MAMLSDLKKAKRGAIAKAISIMENDPKEARQLIKKIYKTSGKAIVIGITGPAGSGKSSLINKLSIEMKKLKLKEDEKGNKITDVRGIRAACKVMKTRFAKPFESVQVKIPWDTGMDPYSGLVELFEKKGILVQTGNRLKYVDNAKKEHIEFRKAWVGAKLDMLMKDFDKLSTTTTEPKDEKNG